MSRLIHFQDKILGGIVGGEIKLEIQHAIFNVLFDGLEPALKNLRDLREKWSDSTVAQNEKRKLIESLFNNLVIALKDRFQYVTKMMGYEIGFMFQDDVKFINGCANFLAKHPAIPNRFVEMIAMERVWIKILQDVRNHIIEHKANKSLEYTKSLNTYLTLEYSETLFDHCWRLIEDIMWVLAIDMTDIQHGLTIQELFEYKQNNNHPQRFGWFDMIGK
jgi:hypothetical protein